MIFPASILKTIVSILLIGSCLKCNQRNSDLPQGEIHTPDEIKWKCYQYVHGGDTIILSMQRMPDKAIGRLDFRFFEKDNSTGDIEGSMKGDTLLAVYVFHSEGLISRREVAFLMKDDFILMGYGKTQLKDGIEVFLNPDDVKFSESIRLKEIVCNASAL